MDEPVSDRIGGMMAKKQIARVLEAVPEELDAFDEPEDVCQGEETAKTEETAKLEETVKADSKPVFWKETKWAGVKLVFKCAQCDEFRDTKDDIIIHVVGHYPEGQQNQIFDQLVKES